jgi:hypothetical protein
MTMKTPKLKWIYSNKLFKVAKIVIFVLLFVYLLENWGIYGLLGLAALLLLMALYKVYMAWELVSNLMKSVETVIWGRPLGREYWTKEEWENRPKRKIVFKWSKRVKCQKEKIVKRKRKVLSD